MKPKVTFKSSKEHISNLMFEFFKRTSIPRMVKNHSENKSA